MKNFRRFFDGKGTVRSGGRWLCQFWSVFGLLAVCTLGEARDVVRIGFLSWGREDPFCRAMEYGARQQAATLETRYRGIEIVVNPPEEADPELQAEAFHALIAKGIDGLILAPHEKSVYTGQFVRFAQDMQIPVVVLRGQVSESKPLANITLNEADAGKLAMQALMDSLKLTERKLVVINGKDRLLSQYTPRQEAAVRHLQELNMKREPHLSKECRFYAVVDPSPATLQETIRRVEQEDVHREIDGWLLLGSWPVVGPGLYPARTGYPPYRVVLADAPPSALFLLAGGHIDAAVAGDYAGWGSLSVDLLIAKLEHNLEPEERHIRTEAVLLTKDNVEEWMAKWAKWML